jgi:isocitrate dehydrogenase
MALSTGHTKAKVLGETLNDAVGLLLSNDKSPSRKAKEIDNRGSSFYLALYWAQALAKKDPATFAELAEALTANESSIAKDLIDCQGKTVDIGGYYLPVDAKAAAVLRPSATLNKILGTA